MAKKLTKEQKQKADAKFVKLYRAWYQESVDMSGNIVQPMLKKPPPPPPILP